MKGSFIRFIILALIFLSCNEKQTPLPPLTVEVENIALSKTPNKVDYFEDDTLELDGLEIQITYSNDSVRFIEYSQFNENNLECTPAHGDQLELSDTEIQIIHTESNKSLSISIQVESVVCSELKIINQPDNNEYYLGDIVDLTGLKLKLVKSNGIEDYFSYPDDSLNFKFVPNHGDTLVSTLDKVEILHTTSGLSANIPIAVRQTLQDIEWNEYNVIRVGEQLWMAENLRTTKLNDGTAIKNVKDQLEWSELTSPAFGWFDNNEDYQNVYGAYYNYFTIQNNNLCPEGWHVPSVREWRVLIDHLGGEEIAGGKLKQSGTENWKDPNSGAVDAINFSALPAGYRAYNGAYVAEKENALWWSSTPSDSYSTYAWYLSHDSEAIYNLSYNKRFGMNVRCIRD